MIVHFVFSFFRLRRRDNRTVSGCAGEITGLSEGGAGEISGLSERCAGEITGLSVDAQAR